MEWRAGVTYLPCGFLQYLWKGRDLPKLSHTAKFGLITTISSHFFDQNGPDPNAFAFTSYCRRSFIIPKSRQPWVSPLYAAICRKKDGTYSKDVQFQIALFTGAVLSMNSFETGSITGRLATNFKCKSKCCNWPLVGYPSTTSLRRGPQPEQRTAAPASLPRRKMFAFVGGRGSEASST